MAGHKTNPIIPALAYGSPSVLPNSHQIDVVDIKGNPRRIFIAVPPHAPPTTGYPVLFTTDANALFFLFSALMRQQSARPDPLAAVAPVIVGLGYPIDVVYSQPLRDRDYTIPAPENQSAGVGADHLLDFIQYTLQPWVLEQLPVNPSCQGLFGHSYGGLFALYSIFTRPSLFQSYTAASPSIWWGERLILSYAQRFICSQPLHGAPSGMRLLLTAGSLEENAPQPDDQRRQRQQERRMVSAARGLSELLQNSSFLPSRFILLEGEDHGSVTTRSAALALREMSQLKLTQQGRT